MTYTTISNDTWDLIAYQQLGSEKFTPQLIAANPKHVATFIFGAGVELIIPTIETQVTTRKPPWKN